MAGGVGPIPVKSTESIVAHGDFSPEIDHGNTFCKVAHPRRAGWKRKPLEHNGRQTPEWPIWSAGGERALASIADGTPHMTMVGGVLMAGTDHLAAYLRLSGGGNPHASTPPSSNMFLVSKRAESNRFGALETLILGGE